MPSITGIASNGNATYTLTGKRLNGISEAVLQLQHRAGERQVKDARLAVTTGYGMTMYRYGGTAAAAILERAE